MHSAAGNINRDALQEGLSEYWRRNTSPREAMEMAKVLRALRKVAGHLGPNAGTVEYAGMSRGGAASILIDPSWVMGRYPVPPPKMDLLAGIVIHEALHRKEWSERVWKLLESDFSCMKPRDVLAFQKLISAGEDIYVDSTAEGSVFGLYLAKARRKAVEDSLAAVGREWASLDALMAVWTARTWGMKTEPGFPEQAFCSSNGKTCNILEALEGITERLKEIRRIEGVLCRCEARAEVFRKSWQELAEIIRGLTLLDARLLWSPDFPERSTVSQSHAGAHCPARIDELPRRLVHEIEHHLATGSTDITPLIYSVAGRDHDEVVPTSRWDFPLPAHPVVDQAMVRRLRMIFSAYSRREATWSRGLEGGKVDGRRLYRAATDGRCFKEREIRPALSWDVTLLVDASGSMRGVKWKIVENTTASLHRALAGCGGRFQAYAYFEADGVCMISSLMRNGRLSSTIPAGRTASGQALIAAALMMPASGKRKLLIHITDGESNLGLEAKYGIECCAERDIPLITLGCGCRDREAMKKQYGCGIEFLEGFRQLPGTLESLFRRVFLYGRSDLHKRDARLPGRNTVSKG